MGCRAATQMDTNCGIAVLSANLRSRTQLAAWLLARSGAQHSPERETQPIRAGYRAVFSSASQRCCTMCRRSSPTNELAPRVRPVAFAKLLRCCASLACNSRRGWVQSPGSPCNCLWEIQESGNGEWGTRNGQWECCKEQKKCGLQNKGCLVLSRPPWKCKDRFG